MNQGTLYVTAGGNVEIPEWDTSVCDVLFWMVTAPEINLIYFAQANNQQAYEVVGELIEVMLSLPPNLVLGMLLDSGKVEPILPSRLQ